MEEQKGRSGSVRYWIECLSFDCDCCSWYYSFGYCCNDYSHYDDNDDYDYVIMVIMIMIMMMMMMIIIIIIIITIIIITIVIVIVIFLRIFIISYCYCYCYSPYSSYSLLLSILYFIIITNIDFCTFFVSHASIIYVMQQQQSIL